MNGSEANRDWPHSYASVIGMMFYMASNTRPDVSFAVHQCSRFTHYTKASHETSVKRICRYIQGTKENGLVFNPSNKLVTDCYSDTDSAGLWGHEDPQDPICSRSRTDFAVSFAELSSIVDVKTIDIDCSFYTIF